MDYIISDIENQTEENTNFRKVLKTGKHSQLVLMSVPPGEDIGEEVHTGIDQLLFIVEGKGEAMVNNQMQKIGEDDVVFVPEGTIHNIKNTGDNDLKIYTIYSPPTHKEGTIHQTKEIALQDEEDHY